MAFTQLSQPIQEVMVVAEAQNLLKKPAKLKRSPEKRNRDEYCRYHKDHGHDTEDCFKLKVAIEKLIKKGHLAEFVTNNRQTRPDVRPLEQQQPLGNINVVSGGTFGGGNSQSSRKRQARASRVNVACPVYEPSSDRYPHILV